MWGYQDHNLHHPNLQEKEEKINDNWTAGFYSNGELNNKTKKKTIELQPSL